MTPDRHPNHRVALRAGAAIALFMVAAAQPTRAVLNCDGLTDEECVRVRGISQLREQDARLTAGNRIVGGQEATDADAAWTVALAFRTAGGGLRQYCGGTLIDRRWVVSAAHCEVQAGDVAIVGRKVLTDAATGVEIPIEKVTSHAQYDPATMVNDIAVLKLSSAAPSAGIPVEKVNVAKSRKRLTVLGWGRLAENGPSSTKLMRVGVRVVSNSTCTYDYEGTGVTIAPGMLCAREAGKDSCQGDSGGPLVGGYPGKPRLVGVVSFGIGCAQDEFPGVYTRVFSYRKWLRQKTGLTL